MPEDLIIRLAREAIWTVLLVGGPVVGLSLVTGLAVSIFQATTQINEQTLAFVPKIVAVLLALILFGPWMLTVMLDFAATLFGELPYFIQ